MGLSSHYAANLITIRQFSKKTFLHVIFPISLLLRIALLTYPTNHTYFDGFTTITVEISGFRSGNESLLGDIRFN